MAINFSFILFHDKNKLPYFTAQQSLLGPLKLCGFYSSLQSSKHTNVLTNQDRYHCISTKKKKKVNQNASAGFWEQMQAKWGLNWNENVLKSAHQEWIWPPCESNSNNFLPVNPPDTKRIIYSSISSTENSSAYQPKIRAIYKSCLGFTIQDFKWYKVR